MSSRYIWHLTLDTGHGRPSPRSEVADGSVAQIAGWLDSDAFEPLPGYRCALTYRSEHCFEAELYSPAGGLMASMAFASHARCGAALWRRVVSKRHKPAEPWLAVLLGPGIVGDPAVDWLGDFERCLAWAFLERSESR